jgi:hypothetical protein
MESYTPWIAGGVCGLVAGLMVLVNSLTQQPLRCPECGTPVPKLRPPANRRQMLWGGWTCAGCGIEIDKHGRKIDA